MPPPTAPVLLSHYVEPWALLAILSAILRSWSSTVNAFSTPPLFLVIGRFVTNLSISIPGRFSHRPTTGAALARLRDALPLRSRSATTHTQKMRCKSPAEWSLATEHRRTLCDPAGRQPCRSAAQCRVAADTST